MTTNSFRPLLSELGDRILPSATLPKPAECLPAIVAPTPAAVPSHPLNGSGAGAYHVARTPASANAATSSGKSTSTGSAPST